MMPVTSKDLVYLDNNATTPVAPEVLSAMMPFLTELWGNPSSAYRFGSQIHREIEKAREQVAGLIGADPKEIFFTSCGTESDNSAIASALETTGKKKVVTTAVEHSALIKQCTRLQQKGVEVIFMPVKSDGTLDFHEVEKAVDEETAIVSVMWANNETGVLFPVEEIAEFCKLKDVIFHTDAVQAVGKIPIQMQKNRIDMLSLAGHKLHSPKGVGVLYIRKKTRYQPTIIGGGQEKGKRGGTENVASIVGLGAACELAAKRMEDENTRVRGLRDRLEDGLLGKITGAHLNGNKKLRLPNTSNISFEGVEAESLLMMMDQEGICASSGSACTTGSLDPSHVLKAMGMPLELARAAIRFSLSYYNSDADVEKAVQLMPGIVGKLRGKSPGAASPSSISTATV